MRHRKYTFKIGRTGSHRRAMLANMVSSLIFDQEITTTVTRAKEARRLAEKMVTLAKKGDLHRRRQAIAKLRNKEAVRVLFEEVAPKYVEREGGYTRIIRLGQRRGDAAELCLLQWVEEGPGGDGGKKKKKKSQKSAQSEAASSEKATESAATESETENVAVAEKASEEAAETAEEATVEETASTEVKTQAETPEEKA